MSLSFVDLGIYYEDTESSLRLYCSANNPIFFARFAALNPSELQDELDLMIDEADMRASLALLAHLEAAFRIDFQLRCERKSPDGISVQFRKLSARKKLTRNKKRPRLDEDIFEIWHRWDPSLGPFIGELRGAFKFRHWLAHGQYWKVGQKYDFQTLYILAESVYANFHLMN